MSHKRVIIPAICFFLAVTIVFPGCLANCVKMIPLDYPSLVFQQYEFDGSESLYALNGEEAKVDEYIVKLNISIERDPESASLYYRRGVCYFLKGEYDKAIADYTKAIELHPEYAYAYNMRGRIYYHKGEYQKAISDCSKAIELDSENAAAYYYNRGFSYDATGEYDKSISDYTKAIELDPKLDEACYRRGLVYKTKGEFDLAASDFEKVIQISTYLGLVGAARQELNKIGK